MHLVSLRSQQVSISGRVFHFERGERLHTENSYKYTIGEFQDLARRAGFAPERVWTDPQHLFSVHFLRAVP